MAVPSGEAIEAYLDRHYIGLETLAKRSGVTPERVLELIHGLCVPPHSHEIRGVRVYASNGFGEYSVPSEPRRYYHPSLAAWVKKAEKLAAGHSLAEVARIVRADFERDVMNALDGRPLPWSRGIDHAWAYVMDGTFGLCLKDLNVASLVQKEVSRARIAAVVRPHADHEISAEERAELKAAIEDYDQVVLPFAPHELEQSSRVLEVGAAIEKYQLDS